MKCPFCGFEEDKVIDSRSSKEGRAIRRRRECLKCEKRYTTYEYIENVALSVIKRDSRVEEYDRQKLRNGIITACKKRPVSMKKIDSIVDKIENEIQNLSQTEVKSEVVGEKVMTELKKLDEVAYVRFASVYRHFKSKEEFLQELKEMENR
ncbi:MAG: transcriptional regulator NrdR [Candidatus Raymondbacteria bacterium RifOxyA12_full_50_37]|uniref:Transcriptional repressor NrdR n=1 Tax=Candidatus Raymondbacteria bacterium RIFOXYD12_FULL_49_13 TaxID=1817890 RepID=A0A1F7F253_UNCRA|nr:MAG: transcriptional regulator NrdR [Candidatus Raymondbacteria bacterium RifOxyA12_full_50_37]OGJ85545.1 MAG: transcriptional regulator NrdR [Candidatus Raymondbacteria bacterium RIFOXYA2_FULL_49_16]OGJ94679.1 MAG: transcriptional regulator NrdR [Candidatus Raymondbacteria bacterium RifOxyC12_full_50_8]OGJ95048.1 MAG: transcriptional regulator NrdR [Candidatus Raymondbacteria bacterium RIFOXYC2_FULL_50_21]OGK00711.1 MAG: transcriptional regulator NrdR [Candidatus Raymondbacteria bacterium R